MRATTPSSDSQPVRLDDPEGFRLFYRAALPRVYGYFLHRCGGSVPTTEDLTQETFLAAIAELRNGTTVATPLPWVLGIARHKLIDHYRRQGRSERLIVPWNDAAERRSTEDRLLSPTDDEEGARDRAIAALATVPAGQRAALVLRHVDGRSVPEVAALLGRGVHAVESLLARGRVGFKRHYDDLAKRETEAGDGSG